MYTVYRDNTDPDSEFPESSKGHQSKEKQSDMAEQEMKHFHIFDKQTNKNRPEKWMLKKESYIYSASNNKDTVALLRSAPSLCSYFWSLKAVTKRQHSVCVSGPICVFWISG